ncbi:S1 family peptidase [Mycobacterium sp. HUMS_1102779]|uniref:S1 family peptidase n=1 Tax=Mycobacterium sp. HUMS_1102779 TaxID=3383487 RepID=UPI00389B2B2D
MVVLCALELASQDAEPTRARTVTLLIATAASVLIAILSFMVHRIFRRRAPQPGAGHLRRALLGMRVPLPTVAALCCAAVFLAAMRLPLDNADPVAATAPSPVASPIPLPPASAIGPGAGIYVDYADGSGGMGCTAGFLVRTRSGRAAVLTAGHCNRPGEPSAVTMNLGGTLPYTRLGTFSRTVSEGDHAGAHDMGLIMIDGDKVPRSSAIAASLPVSGVTTKLRIGQRLCKFGMTTDITECGQVLDVTDSTVTFSASGLCGDSGGPVYLVQNDGTATAVGIEIRGGNPANPHAGCSVPVEFSMAELVQPWLDRWHLTAVVTRPAG